MHTLQVSAVGRSCEKPCARYARQSVGQGKREVSCCLCRKLDWSCEARVSVEDDPMPSTIPPVVGPRSQVPSRDGGARGTRCTAAVMQRVNRYADEEELQADTWKECVRDVKSARSPGGPDSVYNRISRQL